MIDRDVVTAGLAALLAMGMGMGSGCGGDDGGGATTIPGTTTPPADTTASTSTDSSSTSTTSTTVDPTTATTMPPATSTSSTSTGGSTTGGPAGPGVRRVGCPKGNPDTCCTAFELELGACNGNDGFPFCFAEDGVCDFLPCVDDPECINTMQGSSCQDGTCMQSCSSTQQCLDDGLVGYECIDFFCVRPPCMADADCAGDPRGGVCDTEAGTCFCNSVADCEAPYDTCFPF